MNLPTDDAVREAALAAAATVWDPELALDVVTLGLIYDVRVEGQRVLIDMTLTTPGCPVSEQLPAAVDAAVVAALPDATVEVRVVWDPPWTPDRIASSSPGILAFPRRR